MSPTARKIGVLASVLGAGLCSVLLYLWVVMVEQHDTWLLRSCANRWTFRDVPSRRGAIIDRCGRVLVQDEPVFELAVDYKQFRRNHVVGTAVHGANLLMEVTGDKVSFGYGPGLRGPEAALDAMLQLPLPWLKPGVLPKARSANLRFYAVAMLSGLTGRQPRRLHGQLLAAIASGKVSQLSRLLGDVDRAELVATFRARLEALRQLDGELQASGHGSMLPELDQLRAESMAADWNLTPELRSAENRVVPLCSGFAFELAARIGAGGDEYVGLRLLPAVRRVRLPSCKESTLSLLLGSVGDLDRADTLKQLEQRQELALGEEDLDQLVPEEVLPNEQALRHFRSAARSAMSRLLRTSERQGISGLEEAQDARLSGRPGLRLVEHDKRARELQLWSALQVAPGRDMQLTIDLDLQELLEQEAADWLERMRRHPLAAMDKLDVGIAVLDVWTGDVLAVGGAPLRVTGHVTEEEVDPDTGEKRRVRRAVENALRASPSGLGWRGPGDIGSVAKPFVALEHLAAERAGLPHTPSGTFHDCTGPSRNTRTPDCDLRHGNGGRDLVEAIKVSCNNWFYQAAQGLGEAGVERALARVGLVQQQGSDGAAAEFASMWQERPDGLQTAVAPVLDRNHGLLRRAIGYGVQASPLHVARAYASLVTGVLPEAGLLLGEARHPMPLGVPPEDLARVCEGLRACVDGGTASKVAGLRRWEMLGKTGTAEITQRGQNNAWFAGWLPFRGEGGVQLCIAAAVYFVPDGEHGGKVAGELVARLLDAMEQKPDLQRRYLRAEAPR